MRLGIVWFRNDLRIRDNEALARASHECDLLLTVFVWGDRLLGRTPLGFAKTGVFRMAFLGRSVASLREDLLAEGAALLQTRGHPHAAITRVIDAAHAADDRIREVVVYHQNEPFPEEREEADAVRAGAERSPVALTVSVVHGQSLFHVEDIPVAPRSIPDVFTDFRKTTVRTVDVRPEATPASPLPPPPGGLTRWTEDGSWNDRPAGAADAPPADDRAAFRFAGGERSAWSRLEHYFWESNALRRYKQTRNGLLGADYSTKFSPWLACGALSPRSVYFEVKRYEAERGRNDSTYWLVFELIWRDYFHFLAQKYAPDIYLPHGPKRRLIPWQRDRAKFDRWVRGDTGQPFIDANMRELATTGFMSNRGRQNVASFLARDLGIDWTWGAEYFESVLVDYDPASNWGNWSYTVGVGTDPRLDRSFNPEIQARKYDPRGRYVDRWLGELTR